MEGNVSDYKNHLVRRNTQICEVWVFPSISWKETCNEVYIDQGLNQTCEHITKEEVSKSYKSKWCNHIVEETYQKPFPKLTIEYIQRIQQNEQQCHNKY